MGIGIPERRSGTPYPDSRRERPRNDSGFRIKNPFSGRGFHGQAEDDDDEFPVLPVSAEIAEGLGLKNGEVVEVRQEIHQDVREAVGVLYFDLNIKVGVLPAHYGQGTRFIFQPEKIIGGPPEPGGRISIRYI